MVAAVNAQVCEQERSPLRHCRSVVHAKPERATALFMRHTHQPQTPSSLHSACPAERNEFAPNQMAAHLAPHLSHKTALALLPPSLLTPPIESVRRDFDRHFSRWPPHINLIYPFLASPSEHVPQEGSHDSLMTLKQDIRSRIQRAVQKIPPFHITLSADPPGVFSHSKRSKTVWLVPSSGPVNILQAALQDEFSECNSDSRPFTPHLSVGQAHSDTSAKELAEALKNSISAQNDRGQNEGLVLDWNVDKVYVIERKSYHGRFNVVEAIPLRD